MTRNRTQIPFGVADYFWNEALLRQQLMDDLLALFRSWGYADVVPPTFEFADSLSIQASGALQAEMYRFLDRDGSTLALRPEFTTPVARLVATRLHDWPMPQRFCYAGSVFRYAEPRAGRQREFFQAGVELIGAPTPRADAEVLALTVAAMETAGLTEYRVVLGQIGYVGGLLQELSLSPEHERALRVALERKSEPDLTDFLRTVQLSSEQQTTLESLLYLDGSNIAAVIEQAERYCLNQPMRAALDSLRAIAELLAIHEVVHRIDLDLTEIRNLGYYTGMTFEVLTPGLGVDIASGGRYDDLVGHFGPPAPAVGVAVAIDRMLLARQRQESADTRAADHTPTMVAPDVLALTDDAPAALARIQQMRLAGKRIQVEVSGRSPAEAAAFARRVGIPQVLSWTGSGFEPVAVADRVSDEEERL